MLKGILSVAKLDESKAYRLLSTTASDISKFDEVKDLSETTVGSSVGSVDLARLILATRYIKMFQSSILLHVNNAKAQNVNGITKAIDECAYTKTIEDFAKEALKAPETVYLMRLMQVLVHAGFVSLRT